MASQGLAAYSPMFMLMLLGGISGAMMLIVGRIFRPNRPYPEKLEAYECGIASEGNAWENMGHRYYVYAMLFLAFDVEVLFLLPWALVFDQLGLFAFIEMVLFILVLVIGLAYTWAKGALEWRY